MCFFKPYCMNEVLPIILNLWYFSSIIPLTFRAGTSSTISPPIAAMALWNSCSAVVTSPLRTSHGPIICDSDIFPTIKNPRSVPTPQRSDSFDKSMAERSSPQHSVSRLTISSIDCKDCAAGCIPSSYDLLPWPCQRRTSQIAVKPNFSYICFPSGDAVRYIVSLDFRESIALSKSAVPMPMSLYGGWTTRFAIQPVLSWVQDITHPTILSMQVAVKHPSGLFLWMYLISPSSQYQPSERARLRIAVKSDSCISRVLKISLLCDALIGDIMYKMDN